MKFVGIRNNQLDVGTDLALDLGPGPVFPFCAAVREWAI